jgi:hypothetical protein
MDQLARNYKLMRLILSTIVLLALFRSSAYCQTLQLGDENRAYDFLGQFFQKKPLKRAEGVPRYRLKAQMFRDEDIHFLGVDSMRMRNTVSLPFLTKKGYCFGCNKDSVLALLNEADFMAMQVQLLAWQQLGSWQLGRLEAAGVKCLKNGEKVALTRGMTVYKVLPPLFSLDGQTAFFYAEGECGRACGGGSIYLMRRQANGSWLPMLHAVLWES